MEPFITRDGKFLLFNNRNDPGTNTNLHLAERIDDATFAYLGEIDGANTAALEGTPSMDRTGSLFFISTRSYGTTLSTIHRALFMDGRVTGAALVEGVSLKKPGIVTFDAEISADGTRLFFAEGRFSGGAQPRSADIIMAGRDGSGFRRAAAGRKILRKVNTRALEYAPAVSSDLLELFFTRASRSAPPAIFRATRSGTDKPFGAPAKISVIDGFAEAPSLSDDGRLLYYHKLENGRFVIFLVTRDAPPCGRPPAGKSNPEG